MFCQLGEKEAFGARRVKDLPLSLSTSHGGQGSVQAPPPARERAAAGLCRKEVPLGGLPPQGLGYTVAVRAGAPILTGNKQPRNDNMPRPMA